MKFYISKKKKKSALAQIVLHSSINKGGGYGYGFGTHRVCVCYLLMKKEVHIISSSTSITDKNISEKFVIVILVIETEDFHISSKHI